MLYEGYNSSTGCRRCHTGSKILSRNGADAPRGQKLLRRMPLLQFSVKNLTSGCRRRNFQSRMTTTDMRGGIFRSKNEAPHVGGALRGLQLFQRVLNVSGGYFLPPLLNQ